MKFPNWLSRLSAPSDEPFVPGDHAIDLLHPGACQWANNAGLRMEFWSGAVGKKFVFLKVVGEVKEDQLKEFFRNDDYEGLKTLIESFAK